MKFAVIQFPGSNCDLDMLHAIRDSLGEEAEYIWHAETSLAGFDAVLLPGGFSYGDYLRLVRLQNFQVLCQKFCALLKWENQCLVCVTDFKF